MTKKKILVLAMSLAMVAILAVGGSLAYFTDTDSKTNTFTTGKVDITLEETFTQDSKLMPGTSKDGNAVAKVVTVKNESDSEASYVRVHIAVPSALVDQNLNSYNDMLHWNFKAAAYKNAYWSMQPTYTTGDGWTDNGRENQNVYNTTINNVEYTVWVCTYRTILQPGETTQGAAMTQMYLDWRVDTADGKTYTKANYNADGTKAEGTMSYTLPEDGKIPVLVVAEGTQATSNFANAYDALNTAFGTPSATNNPWTNN